MLLETWELNCVQTLATCCKIEALPVGLQLSSLTFSYRSTGGHNLAWLRVFLSEPCPKPCSTQRLTDPSEQEVLCSDRLCVPGSVRSMKNNTPGVRTQGRGETRVLCEPAHTEATIGAAGEFHKAAEETCVCLGYLGYSMN